VEGSIKLEALLFAESESFLVAALLILFGLLALEMHFDALVELVVAALSSDAQALSQDAQARQALVEIAAALAAKNIPTALALQERIKLLR
jgi:hypothetical protein